MYSVFKDVLKNFFLQIEPNVNINASDGPKSSHTG